MLYNLLDAIVNHAPPDYVMYDLLDIEIPRKEIFPQMTDVWTDGRTDVAYYNNRYFFCFTLTAGSPDFPCGCMCPGLFVIQFGVCS